MRDDDEIRADLALTECDDGYDEATGALVADVPDLLDELGRLRAANEKLQAKVRCECERVQAAMDEAFAEFAEPAPTEPSAVDVEAWNRYVARDRLETFGPAAGAVPEPTPLPDGERITDVVGDELEHGADDDRVMAEQEPPYYAYNGGECCASGSCEVCQPHRFADGPGVVRGRE